MPEPAIDDARALGGVVVDGAGVEGGAGGFLTASGPPPSDTRFRLDPDDTPTGVLRGILRAAWPWSVSGAVLLGIGGLCEVLVPLAVGRAVDDVLTPATHGAPRADVWHAFVVDALLIVALYVADVAVSRWGGRVGWYGMQRAQHELSQQLLTATVADANSDLLAGERLSRLTVDVRRACRVLFVCVYPPGELVALAVTTWALWHLHAVLGLTVVIGAPVVLGLMRLLGPVLERRSGAELAALGAVAGAASDTVLGLRTLRGLHAQDEAVRRYRSTSRDTLRATLSARSIETAFDGVVTALGALFSAGLIAIAAHLALSGRLSVGELTAVAGLAATVIGPLGTVVEAFVSFWSSALGAAGRMLDLVRVGGDAEGSSGDAVARLDAGGRDDVSGGTDAAVGDSIRVSVDGEPPIVVEPGLLTVIARDGGAGTSVTAAGPGRVVVAPHAVALVSGSVIDAVGAVVPTSLLDRLSPDRPSSAGEPIMRAESALRAAALTPDELRDGFETDTGDFGSGLSGGQRQRVALARALAAEADVLVLVEPTSSLDVTTEDHAAHGVAEHRRGRSTVVVTASPAFVAVADRVIAPASPNGAETDTDEGPSPVRTPGDGR